MIIARTAWISASIALLATLSYVPGNLRAADDAPAATFALLKFEGACDAQNNRLWLTNSHTFKTLAVKVRWRAAGGKDLVEDFFPAPNTIREIGCAAEGEVLETSFADF